MTSIHISCQEKVTKKEYQSKLDNRIEQKLLTLVAFDNVYSNFDSLNNEIDELNDNIDNITDKIKDMSFFLEEEV